MFITVHQKKFHLFDVVQACVVHVMIFLRADTVGTTHLGLMKRGSYCIGIVALLYALKREAAVTRYTSLLLSRVEPQLTG